METPLTDVQIATINQLLNLVKTNLNAISQDFSLFVFRNEDCKKRVRIKYRQTNKTIGLFYPQDHEKGMTFNYQGFKKLPEQTQTDLIELGHKFQILQEKVGF